MYHLCVGEVKDGFDFLGSDGIVQVLVLFIFFTLFGFLGMSCLAALTKRFGAMKSAVTSTIRKGFTLVASYWLFPEGKHFGLLHLVGVIVFLGGLFLDSTTKLRSSAIPHSEVNMLSEEDEEIGILTGTLNEAAERLDSIDFPPKLDFFSARGNSAIATATSTTGSASLIERRKTGASSASSNNLVADADGLTRSASSSSALGALLMGDRGDGVASSDVAPKEL
jgi:hypothetical protein